ncbi:hypothetical protein N0V88_004519 [Collariella sp. IMI 366227]|nr:hypothetical protein N0V88_004519 [Collariella sp. IMI 366227]
MFSSRGRSKERTSPTKASPPSPSYMSNDQFAAYLADLRNNRVNRPAGARPPPASSRILEGLGISANGRSSFQGPSLSTTSLPQNASHQRTQSDTSSPFSPNANRPSVAPSISSRYSTTGRGKDYYPDRPVQPLKPSDVVPTATYIERGQRWMEKEEAVSLRQAMEDMDLKDKPKEAEKDANTESEDDKRLYNAALDEAAELVWQHQNPGKVPQPGAPYRYRPHLRQNSYAHARTASVGSTQKRRASGEVARKLFSGDQIWEEPDSETPGQSQGSTQNEIASPLRPQAKDPLNRLQSTTKTVTETKTETDPSLSSPEKLVDKYNIHRNPPSQSRNPLYTTNSRVATLPAEREDVPRKHGMEIRSDDIKQATSMKLKDRSAKLPTPSAVSDSPGRPIKSPDSGKEAPVNPPASPPAGAASSSKPKRSLLSVLRTILRPRHAPSVPVISVSDPSSSSIPAIMIEPDGADDGPSIPIIVTPDDNPTSSTSGGSRRPLPTPQPGASRMRPSTRQPHRHQYPVTRPVGSRATARCHECGDFIEGRFVSLSGTSERFHPHCFACYACGTSLEALEISPEPDDHRAARLDRIARRAAGEVLPEERGQTMAEDGDERLRFFCHLDWHELYAPRCKHCKTPIMGEHVVALGAHWHFGHFFCAECGDPFERGMTHIEKDGYAWCVSCQTKRTERRAPKCRKCRQAVIGQYIRALGGEWHDECFRCATCNGGFDDGQIFPMEGRGTPGETVVLCTGCMERELKA